MDQWKLQRVHEDFRVVALGLPVPPYRGNTLDPPLRSRFQARFIPDVPYQVSWSVLMYYPSVLNMHSLIRNIVHFT